MSGSTPEPPTTLVAKQQHRRPWIRLVAIALAVMGSLVAAVPAGAIPTPPTNLQVSITGTAATATWDPSTSVPGLYGYNVYLDTTFISFTANTTFGFSGLTTGSHTVTVEAGDPDGLSSQTTTSFTVTGAPDTIRPSTPGGLSATVSGQVITLSLSNLSTDNVAVTGYRIFNDVNNTPGNPNDDDIVIDLGTSGTGTVTVAGGTYRMYAKAFDAAANLSWRSNFDTVTVTGAPDTIRPSTPGGLSATVSGQVITLSLSNLSTDNVAVTGYRIFNDVNNTPGNPNDDDILIDLGTSGTGTVTVASGTYRMYAKAFDAAANLSWRSNFDTVTVTGATPRSQAMQGWENGTWRGANIYQTRYTANYHASSNAASAPIIPDYTSSDFAGLKAQGANMVVISHAGIFNENPAGSQPHYSLDTAVLQNLSDVVDDAYAEGLGVVIAMRTGPGRTEFTFTREPQYEQFLLESVWSDQTAQDGWVDMWEELAEEFKNHPGVIGFNLMVEPNAVTVLDEENLTPQQFETAHSGSLADWDQLQTEIVTRIRTVDATTPILVEPESWADADWLINLTDPSAADKVVHSIHIYEPYGYTHDDPGGNGSAQNAANTFGQYLQTGETITNQYGTPLTVLELGVVSSQTSGPTYLNLILDELDGQTPHSWAMWLWRSVDLVDNYVDPFSLSQNTTNSDPFLTAYRNHWQ